MTKASLTFSIASLMPVGLIAAAALWGGPVALAAILYLTVFAFVLDQLTATATRDGAPGEEFPAADALSVVLALAHFGLLGLVVWALGGNTGLGPVGWIATFFATASFFGQVSNSNAHELIHRRGKALHSLGVWVYISLLFGHHASAHLLVHHRHVATAADPNSAPAGLSYWRFAPRAWIGSLRAGLAAETRRRKVTGLGRRSRNPYVFYAFGAVLMASIAFQLGGLQGLAAYFGLAVLVQGQLLMSDYVQHYGLRRDIGPDGKPEPVNPRHSWNSPHWFSSHMMLNAPRHSDHHAHPARVYPELRLPAEAEAPMLPYSLPFMGLVALWPTKWRAMMDPRLAAWQAQRLAA